MTKKAKNQKGKGNVVCADTYVTDTYTCVVGTNMLTKSHRALHLEKQSTSG